MRSALFRRGARVAAVAALALATTFASAGTAGASHRGGEEDHAPHPVHVSIGANGIEAPEEAEAGLVSFHVTTDDKNGRRLRAFRPNAGVSVDKVLADIKTVVTNVGKPAAGAAIAAVRDESEDFGGAVVTPDVPETVTTKISPGPVFLLDFGAFRMDPDHPVLEKIELCDGQEDRDLADFPDAVVFQTESAPGQPRFEVHGLQHADDAILVRNNADELHEMMLQPVPAGTTDQQLQDVFDGKAPPLPGMSTPPHGFLAISPGRTVLLETHNLKPGTYALLCFVPDDKNGIPHVRLGMHKVVVLT